MRQYLELLEDIKDNGVKKADRTGVGTISVFGRQMRFDLSKGFPAVTTKKLFMRGIIYELLWMLQGATNIQYLVQNDVKIWNEWAYQIYLEETGKDKKLKRYFRLNAPRRGFGRKGIKQSFQRGGSLGYRGAAINDLIKRMI